MKPERSEHHLKLLNFLRRRIESGKPINDPNYSPRTRQLLAIIKTKLEEVRPKIQKRGFIEPVYAADDYTVLAEYEWDFIELEIGKIRLSIGRRGRKTS